MPRIIYDRRYKPLSISEGAYHGFPKSPLPGQVVVDKFGRVWIWSFSPELGQAGGLGDLGFWGVFTKILGAVAPIFGGGGSKATTEAVKQQTPILQSMDANIAAIRADLEQPSLFDQLFSKRNVMLMGVGLLAYTLIAGKK